MEFSQLPAGEGGMVVHEDGSNAYWDGKVLNIWCNSFAEAWRENDGYPSSCPDGEMRFATLAELTAGGIPESEARGMVHKTMLPEAAAAMQTAQQPVQAADYTWRDWHEGDTVPSVDRVDVIRTEAGAKGSTLKQIDNVVTTSQYWGPSSFVRKWRPAVVAPQSADPNAKMIDRDGYQPMRGINQGSWSDVACLPPYTLWRRDAIGCWTGLYEQADECAGALTCAPMAYRLGLGYAF